METVKVYSIETKKVVEIHTAFCVENYARKSLAGLLFEKNHPNYCRKCGGSGLITYWDDPSAAGVGLSGGQMEYADPCPVCIEKDVCPQCGGQMIFTESDCVSECGCGYKMVYGEPVEGTYEERPSAPECWCFDYNLYAEVK